MKFISKFANAAFKFLANSDCHSAAAAAEVAAEEAAEAAAEAAEEAAEEAAAEAISASCFQTELNLVTLIYQESNETFFIHSFFPGQTPLGSLSKNRPLFSRLCQRMDCFGW